METVAEEPEEQLGAAGGGVQLWLKMVGLGWLRMAKDGGYDDWFRVLGWLRVVEDG